MAYDYDVLVLGAGPGGYIAAIRCAQYGLKTALVEERHLGGTCLNQGCIPTKALLQGAEAYQAVRSASLYGIQVGDATLDYAKLAAFKDHRVNTLRRNIETLEKRHGVEILRGFGQLQDQHTVRVGEEKVTADKLILATGSKPVIPSIEGVHGANVMTSDGLLAMTALPESAVIVGGGVIGVEFATLLSALGSRVTVVEMLPTLLSGIDTFLRAGLEKALEHSGVAVHTAARMLSIGEGEGILESAGERQTVTGEVFLICVGRLPRTDGIGLEAAGVLTERGAIRVDSRMQTNVEGIYAVGDMTGGHQLAHAASAQGLVAAAGCAGLQDFSCVGPVPSCIYTSPEAAFVGLSEKEARERGHSVRVGAFPVSGNGRSTLMGETQGFARIVTDQATGEILGAQILAPRATDMIAEIVAVMRCEGTLAELASTIHPHPTVSEILMEAAHDALGLCCHALPRKKT